MRICGMSRSTPRRREGALFWNHVRSAFPFPLRACGFTHRVWRCGGRDGLLVEPRPRAKTEDRSKIDRLQQQVNQLMSQRYGVEHVGVVDPPFTSEIMVARYPAKFKMPTIPSYDGTTNADKHLENYQVHMLMQNATEAMLCKAFCLTLTGAAW